jgi:1,4-dihydroxy-2-naphthoyl-CoA hydrolase
MHPDDWLLLCRSVRFGDTDAAGVMHFHQLLRWCHEAYEESLERFGVAAAAVFPAPGRNLEVALPIVHCEADYRRPLICGDPLTIRLAPRRLDPCCFEVEFAFHLAGPPGEPIGEPVAARALSRHLAIRTDSRERCNLPGPISRWLEASGLGQGIQPL